jgi:methionyl-tRNA synthetase
MENIIQYLNPNSPFLYILISWAAIWKGLALWRAARNKQTAWYIVLLVVNTLGILEIIYLIFFRKNKNQS